MINKVKKALEDIEKQYQKQEKKLERAEAALKEFKSQVYKDEQMRNMKETLDIMSKDYYRGFPISKEQKKEIDEWIKEHENKYHGGYPCYHGINNSGYSYRFQIKITGIEANIICNDCRNKAFKEAAGNFGNYEKLMKIYDASFKFQESD